MTPERTGEQRPEVRSVALEKFAAIEERGAEALLGGRLIAAGTDTMVYGDGGAGKTTLIIDLAFHLAAGAPWLGIEVTRPLRVLLIENEGPRALLRVKLREKLKAWKGPPLAGRIAIFERPWGKFTFADDGWRAALATTIREGGIDVLIAGPVTRLGMAGAGTLQEVREFMRLVEEVRGQSARCLAVILVHHENKGGAVSGAWEGAGDTLLHVEGRGPGHTRLHVQKARWSTEHHGASLDLAWTDGEGFVVADERDYAAEIHAHLFAHGGRTVLEIASKSEGGIGASKDTVKRVMREHPERFAQRKGGDVGRHPNATVYGLASAQEPAEPDGGLHGTAGASDLWLPLEGSQRQSPVPTTQLGPASYTEPDGAGAAKGQAPGTEGATGANQEAEP